MVFFLPELPFQKYKPYTLSAGRIGVRYVLYKASVPEMIANIIASARKPMVDKYRPKFIKRREPPESSSSSSSAWWKAAAEKETKSRELLMAKWEIKWKQMKITSS